MGRKRTFAAQKAILLKTAQFLPPQRRMVLAVQGKHANEA
jgi:hypothetical protein